MFFFVFLVVLVPFVLRAVGPFVASDQSRVGAPAFPPKSAAGAAGAAVEQTSQGTGPAPALVASFDGLGVGFEGPHGDSPRRNP